MKSLIIMSLLFVVASCSHFGGCKRGCHHGGCEKSPCPMSKDGSSKATAPCPMEVKK